jgi:hypothetical protein
MKRPHLLAAAVLASGLAISAPASAQGTPSKRIAKLLASTDGQSMETAYKVRSAREEYQVLAALGLQPGKQSLITAKKAYDRLDATDTRTGEQRTVWFDISSFYGAGF